ALDVQVHEDTDAAGGSAVDSQLTGAEQGYVAQADDPGRGGGEHGRDVLGSGDDDADQVILVDLVAGQHLLYEGADPLVDLLGGVDVDGGRPSQGPYGGGHASNVVRGAAAASRRR